MFILSKGPVNKDKIVPLSLTSMRLSVIADNAKFNLAKKVTAQPTTLQSAYRKLGSKTLSSNRLYCHFRDSLDDQPRSISNFSRFHRDAVRIEVDPYSRDTPTRLLC